MFGMKRLRLLNRFHLFHYCCVTPNLRAVIIGDLILTCYSHACGDEKEDLHTSDESVGGVMVKFFTQRSIFCLICLIHSFLLSVLGFYQRLYKYSGFVYLS